MPNKTVGSEIKRDDSMTMLTAIPRPPTARPQSYARGAARSQLAGVLTLGLAILVGQLLAAPAAPILEPDSGSYLAFASYRPSVYPLLLALLGKQGALYAQPILAALALTYLGYELLALTRSALLAGATMLAVALNPFLLVYHYKIMSDSLYVSLVTLLLGLLVHIVRKPSPGLFATASLVAGTMVAVRSIGWFTLPLLLLVALMVRSKVYSTWTFMAAAIVPVLLIPLIEVGVRTATHRGSVISTFGVTLYGKAGLIDAPASADQSRPGVALEKTFAPIRELIAASPTAATARYLTINYEVCIQYSCSELLGIDTASAEAAQAARVRIAANPIGFLRIAWRHYVALWSPYGASAPTAFEAANDFLDANRPLPFEEQVPVFAQSLKPAGLSVVAEPAMFLAALLTGVLALAGVAAVAFRQVLPPALTVATIAALAVQGAFVLTALTGVGIPRYMIAMWPAMMVAFAGWGWSLLLWMGVNLPVPQWSTRAAPRKFAKKVPKRVQHVPQQAAPPPELVDPAQLKPEPAKKAAAAPAKPSSEPTKPVASETPEPVAHPTTKPPAEAIVATEPEDPKPERPEEPKPVQVVELVDAPVPTKKAQPAMEAEPEKETEAAKEEEAAAEAK